MYRLLLHIIFYLILQEKQLNIIQIRTRTCYYNADKQPKY